MNGFLERYKCSDVSCVDHCFICQVTLLFITQQLKVTNSHDAQASLGYTPTDASAVMAANRLLSSAMRNRLATRHSLMLSFHDLDDHALFLEV